MDRFGLPLPAWERAEAEASQLADALRQEVLGQRVQCPCVAPLCPIRWETGTRAQLAPPGAADELGLPGWASWPAPIHDMETHGFLYHGKDSLHPELISMWQHWWLETRSPGASGPGDYHRGYMPLSALVPAVRLFPLFRNRFEPIGLAVTHPTSVLVAEDDTRFLPSGNEVLVCKTESIYVRPQGGNAGEAVWLTAALRVKELPLPHTDLTQPTVLCQVDPLSVHLRGSVYRQLGADDGMKHYFADLSRRVGEVFAVYLDPDSLPLAIAQIKGVDSGTGTMTFELNKGVEQFTPTSN